jgi:hypothetical protein
MGSVVSEIHNQLIVMLFAFCVHSFVTYWNADNYEVHWFFIYSVLWDKSKSTNNFFLFVKASTIFTVTGYQYILSAAAFNFGYSYRKGWFNNYILVFFFCLWTAFQFSATLTASSWSCIWRLNCDNDHVVSSVTSGIQPINNPWNTWVNLL